MKEKETSPEGTQNERNANIFSVHNCLHKCSCSQGTPQWNVDAHYSDFGTYSYLISSLAAPNGVLLPVWGILI